ncbi:MAG TPA: hypothetical protein DC054_18740 [Blastocatellia bacterium]|nr:hypothetical protein [Blastocatellia bacterium]
MNRRLPTLLAALSLVGVVLGSTSTGTITKSKLSQDRPADDIAFEEAQTAKLLGVPLQKFSAPQGLNGMDEIPAAARAFSFTLKSQPPSGPPPRVSFETRKIVKAIAPDGSMYEAYCGRDNDGAYEIAPDHGFVSTFENRRQWYENHLGYGYMPPNIYIGKRENGLIRPTLFFRDAGSHDTAPHALAIDSRGMVHLAVADVNISQDNRLDMYSVIGDPKTGKWVSAWLIDRRGFTSWSSPSSAAWHDKVHLLWDWSDVSIHKTAPGMGAYHVEWSPNGFGRKTRIFTSPVGELDAAVDQESGLMVIVLAKDNGGVYVLSRSADGIWTRPSLLHPTLTAHNDVSIAAAGNGAFVIRTDSSWIGGDSAKTKEWLLRPTQ